MLATSMSGREKKTERRERERKKEVNMSWKERIDLIQLFFK